MFSRLKSHVVDSWEAATQFTSELDAKGVEHKIFPNDSKFTVVWSELEASEHNFGFSLLDEAVDDEIVGSVDAKSNLGIALHFAGYGDCTSNDNSGQPVYIEKYEGRLLVRVYGDINSENPTHLISLEGARLEKRVYE
jgi:hypothetical protein